MASRPYTSDRLGIDFRHIRTLVFGPDDQRQIQDMRRSGAVEAMRGNPAPAKLSTQMPTPSRHQTGCTGPISQSTSPPSDVDEARAAANRTTARRSPGA